MRNFDLWNTYSGKMGTKEGLIQDFVMIFGFTLKKPYKF